MITSGVAFVLATVMAIFFVAAYARPAANAEFRARLGLCCTDRGSERNAPGPVWGQAMRT
jgi:hypothetical protein